MGVFESVHENLLQGVSQQVPRSRLPGQLELQENMVSDPVTGLRRRPGSVLRFVERLPEADTTSIQAWRTDIAGVSCDCILDVNTGTLLIREGGETTTLQSDYLKAVDSRMIRHTSVGESLYLCNISKIPEGVVSTTGIKDPTRYGWAYIKASALSKEFKVTIRHDEGTWSGSFTTPDGTKPEHVAQTSLEYIAEKIVSSFGSPTGITIRRVGSYIFFEGAESVKNLSVTTDSGSLYIGVSRSSNVREVGELPPKLPTQADGYIIAVGTPPSVAYYKYESARERWVESAAYGSVTSINNTPVEVYYDPSTDTWAIDEAPWPGRTSGDDDSNPDPDFLGWGITGLSSYQGRLVILSGSWVWLSASNAPKTFYRTTVEDLIDTDPIGVGSSSASSAAFQYAVAFNKDLLLFSNEFQALIPGSSNAVTPSNINLLVTSTYSVDPSVPPLTLGPTLMYATPRSANFFGLMEMLPSPYSDSQYISQDATEHIPRYLPGRCRFATVSSVGGMAVFGSTRDTYSLYVHEYMWSGEEKVLRAWHRWTFKYPVAYAYFSGDLINVVTVRNGVVLVCTVDPRSGADPTSGDVNGYLDYSTSAEVHEASEYRYFEVSQDMQDFYADDIDGLTVAYRGGELDGYELGASPGDPGEIRISKGSTATKVVYGYEFVSKFAPSPPNIYGEDEVPITTSPMRLVRYYITTSGSGEFEVSVWDTGNQTDPRTWEVNPVRWNSTELSLGRTPLGGVVGTVIPCRVNADTSQVVFSASGIKEFNVLALEYTYRHNQRRRRT